MVGFFFFGDARLSDVELGFASDVQQQKNSLGESNLMSWFGDVKGSWI